MHRSILPVVVAASLLLAAGCGGSASSEVVARAGAESTRPDTREAGRGRDHQGLVVDVAGHVRRPGVYEMPQGARVHEAIRAAGGARRGADLGALNRAATLVDGQQVLVAAANDAGAAAPTGPGGSGSGATGGGASAPVSINTGDVAALDSLPGIGPVTAERIVADRSASGPFASIDDLARVPGIGPATVEALRGLATT